MSTFIIKFKVDFSVVQIAESKFVQKCLDTLWKKSSILWWSTHSLLYIEMVENYSLRGYQILAELI